MPDSNLANASSLLWALFASRPAPLSRVNWAGFYVRSDLYPGARNNGSNNSSSNSNSNNNNSSSSDSSSSDRPSAASGRLELLLAPFAGLPACQAIALPAAGSGRVPGVCAAGFLTGETQLVPDVERRAGHIACDARTRSEIVVPLRSAAGKLVGVLDVDCEVEDGFDGIDKAALERIAVLVGRSCDWDY